MGDPYDGIYSQIDRETAERLRQERVDKEVANRLDLIKGYGTDIYPEGTVFKFKKVFESTPDKEYTYVVLKTVGYWYTSGPKGGKYTWDELILWLVSGPKPIDFDDVHSLSEY